MLRVSGCHYWVLTSNKMLTIIVHLHSCPLMFTCEASANLNTRKMKIFFFLVLELHFLFFTHTRTCTGVYILCQTCEPGWRRFWCLYILSSKIQSLKLILLCVSLHVVNDTELNLMIQINGTIIQMEFGMMNSPTKDDQSTSLNTSPALQSSVAMSVKRIVLADRKSVV